MKEQILEIIEQSNSTGEAWDGVGVRYYPIFDKKTAAAEITTHVMEFITWIRENQHQLFLEPTEDIYDYWLNNIYKH